MKKLTEREALDGIRKALKEGADNAYYRQKAEAVLHAVDDYTTQGDSSNGPLMEVYEMVRAWINDYTMPPTIDLDSLIDSLPFGVTTPAVSIGGQGEPHAVLMSRLLRIAGQRKDETPQTFFGLVNQALDTLSGQEWVPVAERLPSDRKNYWVWVERDGKKPKAKISSLNPAKTDFYVKFDKSGSFPIEAVTHWTPISLSPSAPIAAQADE